MKNQFIKQLSMLSLTLSLALVTSPAHGDSVAGEAHITQHEALSVLSRSMLSTNQKIALITALDAAYKNDPSYKGLLDGEFAPEVIPTILEVIEFYSQQSRNPAEKKACSTRSAIIWTCCGVGVGVIGFIAGVAYVIAAVKAR